MTEAERRTVYTIITGEQALAALLDVGEDLRRHVETLTRIAAREDDPHGGPDAPDESGQ